MHILVASCDVSTPFDRQAFSDDSRPQLRATCFDIGPNANTSECSTKGH